MIRSLQEKSLNLKLESDTLRKFEEFLLHLILNIEKKKKNKATFYCFVMREVFL